MAYNLNSINEWATRDPSAFIAECDAIIIENLAKPPIKLLLIFKKVPLFYSLVLPAAEKQPTALKLRRTEPSGYPHLCDFYGQLF